jgi:hypothetical protein
VPVLNTSASDWGMALASFDLMSLLAKRFPLDTMNGMLRKVCFTLVVHSGSVFYVERYVESPLPFVHGHMKTLMFGDCLKHKVNGVPLVYLVLNKLRELSFKAPDLAHLN